MHKLIQQSKPLLIKYIGRTQERKVAVTLIAKFEIIAIAMVDAYKKYYGSK